MTFLLLQTFLLLLAAYFLGAFLACVAKKILRPSAFDDAAIAVPATAAVARAPIGLPPLDIPPVMQPPPVVARPAPPPPRRRAEPAQRGALPLQPMIETGQRPPPRQIVASVDPSRFERALFGPDPNEGIPRHPILELFPSTRTWVTGPPEPWPPKPKPLPEPEPVAEVESEPPITQSAAGDPATANMGPGALSRSATAAGSAVKGAGSAIATGLGSLFRRKPAAAEPEKAGDQEGAEDETTVPATPLPARADKPVEQEAPRRPAPVPSHKFDTSGGDDLQRIRAIDAETERRLKELGVAMFDTIATWTPADVKRINDALGLTDRIDREQWIEQAQILAKGGETYYSRNRAAAIRAAAKALTAPTPPQAIAASSPAPSVAPAAVVTPTPEPEDSEPEFEATFEDVEAESTPDQSEIVEATPPPESVLPMQQARPQPGAAEPRSEPKSVAEMAAAAAAAIAAASASVTRGIKPIEPISPLSKVDPNISMPTKLQDAIREREAQAGSARRDLSIEEMQAHGDYLEEDGDDLKRIRGIGVLIEKRLTAMGITRYDHIANWTSADIDRVSQVLDFKGRIEREGWVEQARILASGGDTEFSRRVDRGDVDTSRDS